MNTLAKLISAKNWILLYVLVAIISASIFATAISVQQKPISLLGEWQLFVESDTYSSVKQPAKVSFIQENNQIIGTISVPDIVNTPTGPQFQSSYSQIKFNHFNFTGKKFSFKIKTEEDSMDGDLDRVTDNLFEGEWQSILTERWQGSKPKFTGKLKMIRVN